MVSVIPSPSDGYGGAGSEEKNVEKPNQRFFNRERIIDSNHADANSCKIVGSCSYGFSCTFTQNWILLD